MTERITTQDLEGVLSRYVRACDRLGLLPDGCFRVGLTYGSKTYGNAFRVYLVRIRSEDGSYCCPEDDSYYGPPPAGNDFLGMTKREAFNTLADRARVLEDVARIQNVDR